MHFSRSHRKLLKVTGIISFVTGVGWIGAQVNKTHQILNNVLDTSIIHFMEGHKYDEREHENDNNSNYISIEWANNPESSEDVTKYGWKLLMFTYARRLLSLTDNESRTVRHKAVKQLAHITNLDNWQYSLLAHMMSSRTAVALARTSNVENRLFFKPSYIYMNYTHEMLVNSMKELLMALNYRSQHPCLEYFIIKAFIDQDAERRYVDHDSAAAELKKIIETTDDILPLCIDSLLHHSSLKDNAVDLVRLNGLPLLMEIYNRNSDKLDVNINICAILCNMSHYPELLQDIYRSGWIKVLASWTNESDVRLATTAATALANFDIDDNFNAEYNKRVYLLHPMHRVDQNSKVDVVFVHGLLGGVFFTWRQRDRKEFTSVFRDSYTMDVPKIMRSSDPAVKEYVEGMELQKKIEWEQVGRDYEFVLSDVPINTNVDATGPYSCDGNNKCIIQCLNDANCYTMCWPKDWLAQDCKSLRILGIDYDTNLSLWEPNCPSEQMKKRLDERSDEFMTKFLKAGLGHRPIVWVTHSMGGLLVKNMLCKAWESDSPEAKKICLNSKAIVFYSTPHLGSRLATISQPTALVVWPSVEIQELRQESPNLIEIHNKFLNLTKSLPMKIVSFVETKSTVVTPMKFNVRLVDSISGNPSIGEFFEVPQNHLNICKPETRMSFLYQKVLNIIKEVSEEN